MNLVQTILLIRHARAKNREDWTGDDRLRPLTGAGRKQAQAIAEELGETSFAQIRTSPAVRCVETVEPLATRAGVKLDIDQNLKEGSRIKLPPTSRAGVHVLCAHGDNIPELLQSLGIECEKCQKGSIWVIKRNGAGKVVDAAYVEVD